MRTFSFGAGVQSTAVLVLQAEGQLPEPYDAFLFANVTFFFSAYARGANTAGMLGVGVLLFVLMTSELFEGTSYYIFMNPFEMPTSGAEFLWFERVLLNRLGVFAAGALLLFLALRRMELREKFLG